MEDSSHKMNKQEKYMSEKSYNLLFPKLKFGINPVITIISFIIGIAVFFPEIEDLKFHFRIILAIAILLTPFLIQFFAWILQILCILTSRLRYYRNLYQKMVACSVENKELKSICYELLCQNHEERNTVEIAEAVVIDSSIHLKLKKKQNIKLAKGSNFFVVHEIDNKIMGEFEVDDVQEEHFYAIPLYIDPVWAGYIRGNSKVDSFPYLHAIILSID